MIAYAAIDLRGGRVVQLVGGRPESERVSLPDPAAVARQWIDCGFAALHVIDLDAALGSGHNRAAIDSILECAGALPVQVGGGVRDTDVAGALFDAGAARVIVGTRAVEDRKWLEELAARWPGRVVVAADIRGRDVLVRGWTASAGLPVASFLAGLEPLPLAAVLVTDVAREGQLLGADVTSFQELVTLSPHPLIAAGGVAGAAELPALARAGVAGVVLGMSLYTGALDPASVAATYASAP